MLQWRIAWREMRRHPGRALLALLSVVIGVATVTAVGLSTGAARRAYQDMYQSVVGRAALEITGVGGSAIEVALLPTVAETPGVATAVPLIQRNAVLYFGDERVSLIALGVNPTLDESVRDYQIVAGQSLSEARGVLLDASLAESLGIAVGDEVKLLARGGLVEMQVVGLAKAQSGAGVASGGVLFMPIGTAQRRFAAPNEIDRIQVVLDDNADPQNVQELLAAKLPVGVQIKPPVTSSSLAEETMFALENGLRLATAFALLSAVFIIMNTFSMNVGQRRRQLSMMRAIGATRRQIRGLLLREAALLGVVGTLAGMVCGLVGARLLQQTMGGLFQTELPPLELKPWPLLSAVGFGLGISLVGAWRPAQKAASLAPVEGISGVARNDLEGHSHKAVYFGFGLLLLSSGLLTGCLVGWLPFEMAVLSSVLLLISLVLLLPLVLRPLSWVCQGLLRPFSQVESRLARSQLLRHGARTTLTIGVLFVATATGLGLANSVLDNVEDVRNWYRTSIVGDFFVRATNFDMETGLSAAVPESVVDELIKIEGVEAVDSLRLVSATVNDQQVIVVAGRHEYPAPASEPASPPLRVTIGSVLSQRLGVDVGDKLTIASTSGPREVTIEEITNDYLAGGLTVRMNRRLAEQLLDVQGVDAYIVKADHARLKQVEQSLAAACAKRGILLQSYSDLTAMIETMMAGVVGSLWGLLVLGLVVAVFGVVNTLGMNVLEQTRELGMLRVVAMTRHQVRKTILSQAVMLGLLGITPGVLAGVAIAYVMNLATMPVTGHPVAFRFHPVLLSVGFSVAMCMVLLSAWIPAERAARLKLAIALRYE